jgi:hypothetical protein
MTSTYTKHRDTVRLPVALGDELKTAAAAAGVPYTGLVRLGVRLALDGLKSDPANTVRRAAAASGYLRSNFIQPQESA